MDNAIVLDNVTKTYRNKWWRSFQALSGVNLQVHCGEAFGFVGPNGAGKSTAIKILVGVNRATTGRAYLLGRDVEHHQARCGVAYVPESPYLYDYLTPMEVLTMGVRLHHVAVSDIRAYCLAWLARFRIEHVADKRIRQFSKGMVQRTALAHALACQPKLLILDEPLSGLDPVGRRETVELLRDYHHQGGTLFFSSHVLHDVESLADRFGLIHQGCIKTIQTQQQLVEQHGTYQLSFKAPTAIIAQATRLGNELWQVEASQEQLWAVLAAVREQGGELREVKPTMNLEKIFFEVIHQPQGNSP